MRSSSAYSSPLLLLLLLLLQLLFVCFSSSRPLLPILLASSSSSPSIFYCSPLVCSHVHSSALSILLVLCLSLVHTDRFVALSLLPLARSSPVARRFLISNFWLYSVDLSVYWCMNASVSMCGARSFPFYPQNTIYRVPTTCKVKSFFCETSSNAFINIFSAS